MDGLVWPSLSLALTHMDTYPHTLSHTPGADPGTVYVRERVCVSMCVGESESEGGNPLECSRMFSLVLDPSTGLPRLQENAPS